MKRRNLILPALLASALALAGCSDPNADDAKKTTSPTGDGGSASSIAVGSAQFPESEIIGELYAQALEDAGVQVKRSMQIGAREVYAPALENGEIDLVPDYTGNLLAYFDPETDKTDPAGIMAALPDALPDGTEVLEASPAENKDSLNVTQATAEEHSLASIADLKNVEGISLAANPEFAERSYGIPGLERVYGITGVKFVPINDGGGPATVKALLDGDVIVADIYSTTPAIKDNNLVTLDDPENLIAAQHVIPFVRTEAMTDDIKAVINKVSAELTTDALIEMNGRSSGDEKASAATIAKDWLTEKGLIGK
ncbi:osmoprotectant transport system substrate-binding protein [Bowdeniella nasicola]|uniref:Osmoprotectant transport system substrate-binding protein n=1 Tax=Bowdeniella nasicola TaxID=208480 RepID=A0A1H3W7W8_9ACTO|nr:ABC transporter substrate-binding protein [Bowdeniella nasicola]SDZ83229.1 osmoprotectant transport system substrate-binding protein [Bowdeniella nasicola]